MRRKINLVSLHHANRSPHIVAISLTLVFFLTLYTFLRITSEVPKIETKREVKSYFVANANHLYLSANVGGDIFVNPYFEYGYAKMRPVRESNFSRSFDFDVTPLSFDFPEIAAPKQDTHITFASHYFSLFSSTDSKVVHKKNKVLYPIMMQEGGGRLRFDFKPNGELKGFTRILVQPSRTEKRWPRIRVETPSNSPLTDEAVVRYILQHWNSYYEKEIKTKTYIDIYWSEEENNV